MDDTDPHGSGGFRRDAVEVLRAMAHNERLLLQMGDDLARYDRPALVVWAKRDRGLPSEHGRRLPVLLPKGQLAEVDEMFAPDATLRFRHRRPATLIPTANGR
jgi:pimeloyl-ACP methyl ester carboxylesterase